MAADASKHPQMSLFSCEMWLCLTASECKQVDSIEHNQGVAQLQLVLYLLWQDMIISDIRAVTPLKLFVGFPRGFHTRGKIEAMSDINLVCSMHTSSFTICHPMLLDGCYTLSLFVDFEHIVI